MSMQNLGEKVKNRGIRIFNLINNNLIVAETPKLILTKEGNNRYLYTFNSYNIKIVKDKWTTLGKCPPSVIPNKEYRACAIIGTYGEYLGAIRIRPNGDIDVWCHLTDGNTEVIAQLRFYT